MEAATERVLGLLGRADQLRVLTAVSEARLVSGHPLDDPSHILLREIAMAEGLAAVRAYLDEPSRRGAALARTVRRLENTGYEALREHGIDPDAVRSIPGAARAAARRLLPGSATGRVDGGTVHWANRHSFAVLRTGATEHHAGQPFAAVTEHAASVFARRYYGFTVSDRDSFFCRPESVRVVAAGYDWLAGQAEPVPGLTAWQRHGVARLRDIPADAGGGRERQVLRMYCTHEVAHTYRLDGREPVLDMLRRTGHDPGDAFRHGIPGPRHLGAWDRLASGGGPPASNTFDVTFLLSDVLATLTQAIAGPDELVNRLQAAYLWQAVAPPTPASPRRGVIVSLRTAESLDLHGLMRELEKIFVAARTSPATVPALLAALEHHSLRLLHDRFPYAVPTP
ncbi:hypothetical protein [Actinomadura alba]|uniref:Uncharacterized protein n=1 Tax=Actinomadura alba TaxID=406431 RepID=A0ABR7LY35_9ACTN|nr:hypothetical protein [Actinomadura alba]MBC6469772.1 hypothetical protein [Actinomadura alba]